MPREAAATVADGYALAKQGKGWREILAHYYTGAEIQAGS